MTDALDNDMPYSADGNRVVVVKNGDVVFVFNTNLMARHAANALNNAFLDGQQRMIDKMAVKFQPIPVTGTIGGGK